jgi:hypothetical protein
VEDDIKMNLKEIEWGGMDWIHLAQNRWMVLIRFDKMLGNY